MSFGLFQVADPLRAVSAAVTPVVMISASAILISGINAKHQSLSDRVRSLAAECRARGTTADRHDNIIVQIRFFRQRLRLVFYAHLACYLATACFIAMVMVISITVRFTSLLIATLPFFLAGVLLLLLSVAFEIRELRMSGRTMRLELNDIEPAVERPKWPWSAPSRALHKPSKPAGHDGAQ